MGVSGKGVHVDTREWDAFLERIKSLRKAQADLFFQQAAKTMAARLLALVIPRTPVKDGVLRRGWTAKTHAEAQGGAEKDATSYAQSLEVNKIGNQYQIEVINPVEYASYVEFGHRQTPGRFVPAIGKRLKAGWVEGRFFLTISEQELQTIAPDVLTKELELLLKGAF